MEKNLDQTSITARVLELIDESNMTDRKFAIAMKIDVSNFRKKLSGSLTWTINDIEKLCTNGNVAKQWLVNGEGEKYSQRASFQDESSIIVKEMNSNGGDFTTNVRNEIVRLTILMTDNDNIINEKKRENEVIMQRLNSLCTILKG